MMKVGDLVRVNKWCSAGGLIGRVGIVKGFKSIANADCARIHIDTGWTPLVRLNAMDVISSISEERKDGQ